MNDAQLWQDERDGQLVAHCRDRIRHQEAQIILARQNETRTIMRNRMILRPKWAA